MKLQAEILAARNMELDLLIVPGGVISGQIAKGEVLAWLRGEAKHCRLSHLCPMVHSS